MPDPDEGITTDELMRASGVNPEEVRRALHDLERLGIAGNDTAATPFVRPRRSASIDEPPRGSDGARVCAHGPVCGRPPPTWSRTTRRESAQARPRSGAGDAAPQWGSAVRHRRPTPHRRPAAPPAPSLLNAGRRPWDRSAGRDHFRRREHNKRQDHHNERSHNSHCAHPPAAQRRPRVPAVTNGTCACQTRLQRTSSPPSLRRFWSRSSPSS